MFNRKYRYNCSLILIFLSGFFIHNTVFGLQVFPGAVGFGTDTRAAYADGKNPTIFIVDNLTNSNGTPKSSTRNGIPVLTGSIVEAVNYDIDNKFIIFEVSGTVTINARLVVDNNNVTIAGQTAPAPGITLRGCV
ncbi:MAG: hypothetical protein KJO26_14220, partial [Deltaproteobacteria bacterium]|nr:hypothetical protein [Deltaproteobacteria bacterium]